MKRITTKISPFIIPILVCIFNILILLFPLQMIGAAREGLNLWFNQVAPSLLPFIIGANILVGSGTVSFIGTLLEPIMMPLFGVRGAGGFALITGMTSGYPMGAKITALLRERKEISQVEAQRLIAFCNNAGPLFILGAVGVGMFNSVAVGYFIMLCHYGAAVVTGLIFKYYKKQSHQQKSPQQKNMLSKAYRNMRRAQQQDGRTFGALLGDSIKSAMETIALIGGFIILFCVLVEVTEIVNITSNQLPRGFLAGVLEVTNGAKILAGAELSRLSVCLTIGIISFGGFSIHSQALTFIHKTDINAIIYVLGKLLHGLMAFVVGWVLFPLFSLGMATVGKEAHAFAPAERNFVHQLIFSTYLFFITTAILFIAVALITIIRKKHYHKGTTKSKW